MNNSIRLDVLHLDSAASSGYHLHGGSMCLYLLAACTFQPLSLSHVQDEAVELGDYIRDGNITCVVSQAVELPDSKSDQVLHLLSPDAAARCKSQIPLLALMQLTPFDCGFH